MFKQAVIKRFPITCSVKIQASSNYKQNACDKPEKNCKASSDSISEVKNCIEIFI
jgi:hypothetical protein